MNAKEYLKQFVQAIVNGNNDEAKVAHKQYTELKSKEIFKNNVTEAKLTPGYSDYAIDRSDDGDQITNRQRGINYETDDSPMKFEVSFFHPDRDNEGRDTTYPATEIDKKYTKQFATMRQAEKYLNSPYVLDMIKNYRKANQSIRPSENDIGSVNYNPETNLVGYINQINLTKAGQADFDEVQSERFY